MELFYKELECQRNNLGLGNLNEISDDCIRRCADAEIIGIVKGHTHEPTQVFQYTD